MRPAAGRACRRARDCHLRRMPRDMPLPATTPRPPLGGRHERAATHILKRRPPTPQHQGAGARRLCEAVAAALLLHAVRLAGSAPSHKQQRRARRAPPAQRGAAHARQELAHAAAAPYFACRRVGHCARRHWSPFQCRFDYTGHGESSGTFKGTHPGDWYDDALLAVDALTDEAAPLIIVGGLRRPVRVPRRAPCKKSPHMVWRKRAWAGTRRRLVVCK